MKATELVQLTEQELIQKFEETKKKLFELRFQLEMGQLKNTSTIKQVKKDIARIKTILRERELGIRR
ncbi:MAG TPA: 50S ribosomal protein L29 [Tepiditoga sp.]|nr:50S ribosomal protein L29 [Thermotogota bacterium]HOO74042.1 50S ribosomal protein L29 [Tepiditoga sp.]